LVTGIPFVVYRANLSSYFTVSSEYFRRLGIHRVVIQPDLFSISALVKKVLPVKLDSCKILLCAGGVVETGFVDNEEYARKTKELIDVLVSHYGTKAINIKMHPRYPQKYSNETQLDDIPSWIPASTILRDFDVVISYSSAVLFEASNADRVAICLMDYYRPRDQSVSENVKMYLKDNTTNQIHYPRNIGEMESILNEVFKDYTPIR